MIEDHKDDKHEDEPPLDYTDDLPESAGGRLDQFFWWATRNLLPSWLDPTSRTSEIVLDHVYIDCAWCLFCRGVFLGAVAGVATGLVVGLLF